jgi:hypothetical protein
MGPQEANVSAHIRAAAHVSMADAHLGAALQDSQAETLTVLTSDRNDIAAPGGDRRVTVVRI